MQSPRVTFEETHYVHCHRHYFCIACRHIVHICVLRDHSASAVRGGCAAIGVSKRWRNPLAAVLLAGVAGLLIGLWFAPVGIAAAVGPMLYFLGGIGFHVKAKAGKRMPVPAAYRSGRSAHLCCASP
ncbi:DoxX family protein [Nocardia sp. NPDC051463]|uniref:DoxX family protein n=1 Tax=Nocardia sp. NPDC051463 TaxID=3154845 RepID=UPI00343C0D28